MSSLAERLEQLSPAKRAAFARLLERQSRTVQPIPRAATGGPAPLSFAQQRLWFLDRMEPGNPFYNISTLARIEGPLDAAVLERSLQTLIARHDSLRTTFAEHDGRPVQVVARHLDWSLAQVELGDLPAGERDEAARALARDEARRPFDLGRGPLLRARLVRLAAGDHLLLLTIHHIIGDGWSLGVLRQELAAVYEALAADKPIALPPLAIQYPDFAIWQRSHLAGETLDRQLNYWKERLANVPTTLDLPTDRPRPAVQSYRGASLRRRLSGSLCEQLRALCREERVTLFMTLLAGFQALLARYSGQQELAVGSPIANRTRPELDGLVGLLANTLVLHADLSDDPTFRQLLSRVRETTLEAYAHQDLPFEKLVETLETARDLSRSPLVQVMFVLQNIPLAVREVGGLRVAEVAFGVGESSNFDLTLNVDEVPDGLDLMLVYNTDLFDAPTVERLLSAYETLLAGATANPEQRVSRLPLVGARERHEQLVALNDTHRDFPRDRCIHHLFEAQAAARPEAAAVSFEGRDLSYSELNHRANQLAHFLLDHGLQPEEPVGLCLDRSPELIVALLAVLKAGAAYVPLDPAYPQSRLEFMLRDAQVKLILTQRQFADRLPTELARSVYLDEERAAVERCSGAPPATATTPDNLAYIIYTSGSTGEPKGVEVQHRGLVNHAIELSRHYGLEPGDRLLQYLSLSFDAAGEELFPTLTSGATLVLHPKPTELSPRELLSFCREQCINILHLPVLMWHQMVVALAAFSPSERPRLKTVLAGGDTLSPEKLRLWHDLTGGQTKLLYAYGLTEATITTLLNANPQQGCRERTPCRSLPHHSLPTPEERHGGRSLQQATIPLGRPIANTNVYVLDAERQPLPAGARGELFVGGVGLARGYRNRPELTAQRFIPHPFDTAPGARLYRTGDMARLRPDGSVEFLGRIDQQVKIRGFRIEPGEIEAALGQHPQVREAAVIARDDLPGQKRLVAYIVPAPGETPTTSDLRSFLKSRLPEHMVPAAYVVIEALPLTATGKLDRRGLPAPDSARPALDRAYVPPQTEREQQLAEIWSGVLGIERVGIHDNFFELGGDSILSIQVVSRANAAGLRITPKQLFQHQTIAELADVAGTAPRVHAEQGAVTGPVTLTPIQRQFFDWELAEPQHFNQSALLAVRPGVPPAAIEQALTQLIAHHDALRLRFMRLLPLPQGEGSKSSPSPGTPGEGMFWQQTSAAAEDAFHLERFNLSTISEDEQPAEIERHAAKLQAALDLSSGPLIRAALFDLGTSRSARLLIVIHHLVVDAVSWRILLEDLQLACSQSMRGEPIALLPKTTSFQHWAHRLQEYAGSPTVESELNYWFTPARMRDCHLPVDLPEGDSTVGSMRTVECTLEAEQTRALLHDVPQAYRTQINDALLTALAETLSRWTGDQRILIDLEGHGREPLFEDVDLSRTIGWFTTLFPVQLRQRDSDSPGEALKSVKEQLRQIPHGGIGYGLLRWLSSDPQIAARLAALPRAELSFNYLGQFDQLLPADALFDSADEPHGPNRAAAQHRSHLLEVVARVAEGRLHVDWHYSSAVHRPQTVQWLAESFISALERLIEHCLSADAGGFTPSDFPLAGVDEQELTKLTELLAQLDANNE